MKHVCAINVSTVFYKLDQTLDNNLTKDTTIIVSFS